ncbi:MAG: hypothetical protein C0483_15905 [Pirellula sp.]|nr:hypothetical protein [Pirellula sp.]
MSHVDALHDWSAVASLRDDWNRLYAQTPGASFFHSFDWLETYWRFYGEGQSLRVLIIREGNGVTGIVPLTLITEPTKLGAARVLTYPMAYWGTYYGPVGPQPRASLAAALEHLSDARRDWDLLDLRFAPPAVIDPADTVAVMTTAGFAPVPRIVDHTSLIDLPKSFDDYLDSRGRRWRTHYGRWLRRARERGELRYVRYVPRGVSVTGNSDVDADPRWDLYDHCESIARRSWQGSSTSGTTLTHEPIRPFLRAMHETACRSGAADVNLLYLDDKPLAFFYAYRRADTLFGLRTGFDASLSKDGVGNIMYMHVLEDSIARGDKLIDLGPGSLKAKEPLRTRLEPIYRLPHANTSSWRGLAWRMKEAFTDVEAALAEYNADFSSEACSATPVGNTSTNAPSLVHQL